VAITDAALVAAASLSNRYITSRQLPDKAIDLVDEAASRLRMEIDSSPEEIDQLRRTVERMQMQKFALEKESDPGSVERLNRLTEDLANTEEQLRALETRWEAEKQGLNRVGELKKEIDELRSAADRALREGDLVKASEISYGAIPALEKEMEAAAGGGDRPAVHGQRAGRPAGRRRGGGQLDRHPDRPAAAGLRPRSC
jgi:ATP-dependent Clp protease ATP-binding subunit ClpB